MDAKRPGRIITFYSYKGGTGRSMALANVAWILAAAGKRVLMIDWDLEAPGLHRYFRPFLIDDELSASEGLIDLVDKYANQAIRPVEPGETPDPQWYLEYADFTDYVLSVTFDHFPPGAKLDLLPAGRQGESYAINVSSFNWQNFYDRLGGGGFFEAVKDRARAEYDYVLIDSRTGVSDTSGICSVQMPDTLVVCFTYNNQSVKGALAVARSAEKMRRKLDLERQAIKQAAPMPSGAAIEDSPLPYRVFAVPMRVDSGESDRLAIRQAYARDAFSGLVAHVGREIGQYWNRVEVPHTVFYSYEEVLAPFKDDATDSRTVLAAFVWLASFVTDGGVADYRLPLAPDVRQKYLDLFAETPLSAKAKETLAASQKESEEQMIVRLAETAMTSLNDEEKGTARRVLSRLVRLGRDEEGGGYFPIRATLSDYTDIERAVVAKLTSRSLLTVATDIRQGPPMSKTGAVEQTVALADDRLLKVWKSLLDWLDADREFLLWRQQLRTYLTDWEKTHREPSALLSGRRLSEAEYFSNRRRDDLNAAEQVYVRASLAQARFQTATPITVDAILLQQVAGEPTPLLTLEPTPAPVATAVSYVTYNELDAEAVLAVPAMSRTARTDELLSTEIDRDAVWEVAVREALVRSRSMTVFVGVHGLSQRQQRELAIAYEHRARLRQAGEGFPIVPVIIPGAGADADTAFIDPAVDLLNTPSQPKTIPELLATSRERAPACPYPGLRAFRAEDAEAFHGRDSVVNRLVKDVGNSPVIMLTGPPGSGRKSVVAAGLAPRLFVASDPSWKVATCSFGGGNVVRSLAESLVRAKQTARSDEELESEAKLFTTALGGTESTIRATISSVLKAWPPADRLLVVVRDVQIANPELNSWRSRLQTAPVALVVIADGPATVSSLPAPTREELRAAIEQPAKNAGLDVERTLVERLIGDVDGHHDALPVLQFCLRRLYEVRSGTLLTAGSYDEIGTAQDAIARWAEARLATVSVDDRGWRILSRLVAIPETGPAQARSVAENVLDEAWTDDVERLLQTGLIRRHRETGASFDVYRWSHEILAHRWTEFADRVNAERERLRMRLEVELRTLDWSQSPTRPLVDSPSLAAMVRFAKQDDMGLTTRERKFVRRCEEFLDKNVKDAKQRRAKARAEERSARLKRTALIALIALVGIALSIGIVVLAVQVWKSVRPVPNGLLADPRSVPMSASARPPRPPVADGHS